MTLRFSLKTCYSMLCCKFDCISLRNQLPIQLTIRLKHCTFLLFSTGQFRLMGSLIDESILSKLDCIYSEIVVQPKCVSQTVCLQLNQCVNLHKFNHHFENCKDILYLPEIFPAIRLFLWKPLHVNLFSSGKVIVLGQDAYEKCDEILDWLYFNVLLYA